MYMYMLFWFGGECGVVQLEDCVGSWMGACSWYLYHLMNDGVEEREVRMIVGCTV